MGEIIIYSSSLSKEAGRSAKLKVCVELQRMDWKAPSCDLCNGPVKASCFPPDSEVKNEKKASAGKSRIKSANILS